jgi:predicted DNA-binding transcriptional regulator AlpA
VLNFTLSREADDPADFLDALFEAGCDDAVVGVGRPGMVGLDFARDAESAEAALRSAIDDVVRAIPRTVLVQAGPDLVGLTDVAKILGFSRQNMRKYAAGLSGAKHPFPSPSVLGEPSLWHLAEIGAWLRSNTAVSFPDDVFAVSKAAAQINWEVESGRVQAIRTLS